jgi:hypothetical protein
VTHQEALKLYDAYFSGALERQETKAFHAHLNDCEDCKVRLRSTRASLGRRGGARSRLEAGEDARLQEILRRNRTMTYAALVILICFFFFFRLHQAP